MPVLYPSSVVLSASLTLGLFFAAAPSTSEGAASSGFIVEYTVHYPGIDPTEPDAAHPAHAGSTHEMGSPRGIQ